MGKFTRLRKNKKYSYTPRYYDDKGEGNPFKIEHKLDQYRTSMDSRTGLKGKFSRAMDDFRSATDVEAKRRFLIIFAILIFIVLYIIDFDLSIFFGK